MATSAKSKPTPIRITFTARYKAGLKYDKRAKVYVSYAPALEIYSQGKTKARAKQALESAVTLFLSVAYQKGVLGDTLKAAGFSQGHGKPDLKAQQEYIHVLEEKMEEVLERKKFPNIFELLTSLPLETVTA